MMKAFSLSIFLCVLLGKLRLLPQRTWEFIYIYVYYIHFLEKRKRVGKRERAWVVFCCPLGLVFALFPIPRGRESFSLLCFYLMADAKASKWIIKLQYVWTRVFSLIILLFIWIYNGATLLITILYSLSFLYEYIYILSKFLALKL